MAVITDSTTGRTATVNDKNRLEVSAIAMAEDKDSNKQGFYNSIFFEVTPAGANDKFLYLTNTGSESLSITDIRISSSVVTNILVKKVTGTPVFVTGTAAAVTNLNLGSSLVPNLTVTFDTDITGLADDGVLFFQECSTVDTLFQLRIPSNIIIPQGQSLAIERVAATGAITCLINLTRTLG